MNVHIVTDSTSDLSASLLEEYGVARLIHIVPLTVHFGDEEFQSGVDLSTSEFYARLEKAEVMPRTSQPSPAAFIELYKTISKPGDTILSYHISSRLSGTFQSALLATKQFSDRRIEVVDTKSASMGLGIIALRAALGLVQGESADAVLNMSREWIANGRVYFLVDTLDYLQKNGRIGRAQALVGGLLNVKPILTLDDGVVTPLEKARGQAKARGRVLSRVVEFLQTQSGGSPGPFAAVVHARAPEDAEALREKLQSEFPNITFLIGELGPTVGTHAGPGTLGVACFGC